MARLDLSGATAVVTGGSRGIGPHIAAALAERGARVALVARSHPELEMNARRLADAGAQAIAVAADVTDPADRHAIVEAVERELGPIDVLVSNAGGDLQRELHNLTEAEIEGVGVRTIDEVGIALSPKAFTVSPVQVGKATVRAIVRDKAELALLPGPGKLMRALMDRYPGMGPAMNRLSGADRTMETVAEYREREAALARATAGAR